MTIKIFFGTSTSPAFHISYSTFHVPHSTLRELNRKPRKKRVTREPTYAILSALDPHAA